MDSERFSEKDVDADRLALLGKKQVLKRRFGLMSITAFATCELVTWETVLALFSQGYDNGGPAGLVYGFLIAWLSTLSVYTVISELASMAPISSGQYYWVSPAPEAQHQAIFISKSLKSNLKYLFKWVSRSICLRLLVIIFSHPTSLVGSHRLPGSQL